MTRDAAKEARMRLAKLLFAHEESNSPKAYMWEDYGPDVHEEYAVFADRILAKLAEMGFAQVSDAVRKDSLTNQSEPEALKACPFCGDKQPMRNAVADQVFCAILGCPLNEFSMPTHHWNTRPDEDRKADEGRMIADPRYPVNFECSVPAVRASLAKENDDLRIERDALRAQIERLTSDEAVEAAESGYNEWAVRKHHTLCGNDGIKAAITEALRVAGEGATESSDRPTPLTLDL